MDPGGSPAKTEVGNYFVANYPPFSAWSESEVGKVTDLLSRIPKPEVSFGLYLHLPFCRKRCDFCYFKVYTDKDSKEIASYLQAIVDELDAYVRQPYFADRKPRSIYFGGGTPSYLSVEQLEVLFRGIRERVSWDAMEEVAFECEPGTLQEKKITALKELGVTRLSLGVENFNAEILEKNNRAHRAKEIFRTYEFARETGFDQINLDLIAGMVGETDANWQHCIEETLRLAPDSVTIYQMEIPYNTTLSREMQESGDGEAPVADWETKRRWTDQAFRAFEAEGYTVGSAYTAKKGDQVQFVYRDSLWTGNDMLGLGVSSFSHAGGIHFQNEHQFGPYVQRIEKGELPIHRALALSDEERLIREFILQLKLGRVSRAYFRDKFGVEVLERFREPLQRRFDAGDFCKEGESLRVTRSALLTIDSLLHAFFLEQHQGTRYA